MAKNSPAPEADAPQSPKLNSMTLRRVVGLFHPYRFQSAVMLGTVAIGVLLGLAPPFFLRIIFDELVPLLKQDQTAATHFGTVSLFSGITVVVTLFAAGVTLLYGFQSVKIGQKIMCDLRLRLFTHLQGMSLRFFTSARTGDIQTRLISDVGGIQNVVSNTIVDAISNIAIVISSLVAMVVLDWRLTLLSVSLIPFFALLGRWIGEYARNVRKGTQEQTSELNSMMQENLSVSGALLGKTIGKAEVLEAKFDRENHLLADWQIKASILQYVFFGMMRIITQIIPALIYWLAAFLMFRHDSHITLGLLVAFASIQARMFFPLTGVMSLQVELISSLALFDRIFEYIDMPHDISDQPGAHALEISTFRGEVTYDNVGFKYEQTSEDWTLRHVSFEAKPGQLIALVGPSGAGKTTLTYLIPRLYDSDEGTIKVDGVDIRDITMDSLKQVVGMVTQETYLLHASIGENLRLAKPDATDEELIEACKAAAIHDHIAGLEDGYRTTVGERGYKLSGGEKQRLAIARAILKNPRILILDEATSALDTHSERLIQGSLNNLMEGRTTFAIAHRLSTILNADLILVLMDGRVVERGRHADLLALDKVYAKLYSEQFSAEQERAVELV